MPNELLDEIKSGEIVDVGKLSPKEIANLRISRWKARTDLFYLLTKVLGKDKITREFNGPLIDHLQKFPKPKDRMEATVHDQFTVDGWRYKPLVPDMRNLEGKRKRLIIDSRGSYKCLCTNSLVRLNTGRYEIVSNLKIGDYVAATNSEESLVKKFVRIENLESFRQPCVKLVLRSGRKLEVSNNHPFRTILGWQNAENLQIGARVALQAIAEEPKNAKPLPDAELIGWLIGDGCLAHGKCSISSHTETTRDYLVALCTSLGYDATNVSKHNIVNIRGYRARLRALGLQNTNSRTKKIPSIIFESDTASISKFLYGIFMSDGCLSKRGLALTTVNKNLAFDIQRLMLRVNIPSRVMQHNTRYKGKNIDTWRVIVSDSLWIKKFINTIGWGKTSTWTEPASYNPNINTVPKEWRKLYPKQFFRKGRKPKWLDDKWGAGLRKGLARSLTRYNSRKERIYDLGRALNDDFLKFLGTDEIFWDEVLSIEDIGTQETIGVQTESKTICVEDVITHNTTINCEGHGIQININYPLACIGIFQYNLDKAESIIGAIKDHYCFNGKFRTLFPELCPPIDKINDFGTKAAFSIWDIKNKRGSSRREQSFMAAALEKGLAGYHFEWLKYSDIVDPQNSENLDQCLKTIHQFGQSKFLLIDIFGGWWIDLEGTRYHFGDVYGHAIKEWEEDQVAGRESLWEMYTRGVFVPDLPEIKFLPYELKENVADKLDGNGLPIPWNLHANVNNLLREEASDPTNFSAQMRNRPVGGRGGMKDFEIKQDPITKEYSRPRVLDAQTFEDKVLKAYTVISVDTAETVSERANYTAIAVADIDRFGRTYVKNLIRKKLQPKDVALEVISVCDTYKPDYLIIEETGFTRGLDYGIKREWELFPYHHVPSLKLSKRSNQKSKEEIIRLALQHAYNQGDLIFIKDNIEEEVWQGLIQELIEFPRGTSDDILDAIADIFIEREWYGREFAKQKLIPDVDYSPPTAEKLSSMIEVAAGVNSVSWANTDTNSGKNGFSQEELDNFFTRKSW